MYAKLDELMMDIGKASGSTLLIFYTESSTSYCTIGSRSQRRWYMMQERCEFTWLYLAMHYTIFQTKRYVNKKGCHSQTSPEYMNIEPRR